VNSIVCEVIFSPKIPSFTVLQQNSITRSTADALRRNFLYGRTSSILLFDDSGLAMTAECSSILARFGIKLVGNPTDARENGQEMFRV